MEKKEKDRNVYERLGAVQANLSAPKGQVNKFGNYRFRSCEDILKALKPLLRKNRLVLILKDQIVEIAGRVYVEATATAVNADKPLETISTAALARESLEKKGMDSSQITGSTSSYARKYALNGLFAIDDSKDADTFDNTTPKSAPAKKSFSPQY